ncbi:hypothetical protein ACFL0W_02250 [Nanoarchaeota archaeon]
MNLKQFIQDVLKENPPEVSKKLNSLKDYLKQNKTLLNNFLYLSKLKVDILEKIADMNFNKRKFLKKQLIKASNKQIKIINSEIALLEKENPLLNFLNGVFNKESFLGAGITERFKKDLELIVQIKKTKALTEQIHALDQEIRTTVPQLKEVLEKQKEVLPKFNIFYKEKEDYDEINEILNKENELSQKLFQLIVSEFSSILMEYSLIFSYYAGSKSSLKYPGTIEGLLLVHLTNQFPYKGVIRSSLSLHENVFTDETHGIFPTFSTIHFTLNHVVKDVDAVGESHSWKDKKVVIIIPMYNFPKHRIIKFGPSDTFVEGNLKIPPDSFVIVAKSIFKTDEELEEIRKQFHKLGIGLLIVEQGSVYNAANNFLLKVGRSELAHPSYGYSPHHKLLESFAKESLNAYFSYESADVGTISREFSTYQNQAHLATKFIRKNHNVGEHENGLFKNSEIIFETIRIIHSSFKIINENYKDKRFNKQIAVLLVLLNNLVDLVNIFVSNEIHTYSNFSEDQIAARLCEFTKPTDLINLPYRSSYKHIVDASYSSNFDGYLDTALVLEEELQQKYPKQIKNILTKEKKMQEIIRLIQSKKVLQENYKKYFGF